MKNFVEGDKRQTPGAYVCVHNTYLNKILKLRIQVINVEFRPMESVSFV